MRLSVAERWILANQYRLMQMLSDKPIPHYEIVIRILESGYEDEYRYAAQYLRETSFPQEVADEVNDILSMFTQMQWIKDRIDDRDILGSPVFEFSGFDGNNSSRHLEYAGFLHKLGRYRELGDALLINSHSDNINTYRRMVEVWKSIPEGKRGLQMTPEDVRAILAGASK